MEGSYSSYSPAALKPFSKSHRKMLRNMKKWKKSNSFHNPLFLSFILPDTKIMSIKKQRGVRQNRSYMKIEEELEVGEYGNCSHTLKKSEEIAKRIASKVLKINSLSRTINSEYYMSENTIENSKNKESIKNM